MLYDGLSLAEGTSVSNLTIASGTSNPTSPTTGELFYRTDSPNEGLYVYSGASWDAVGSGDVSFDSLNVKPAVRAATTANITLSGTQTIDGVSIIAGDRVLVKNQSTGSQNGIYVAASGSWARAADFDGAPTTEVKAGDFVFVTEGTTFADTGWVLTNNGTITIGTTALTFAQFSSGSSALTSTYIGYGSESNLLTGSASFTWDNTAAKLSVGTTATAGVIAGSTTGTTAGSGGLTIITSSPANTKPGVLAIQGANASQGGGDVTITGGSSGSNAYPAGNITITTGQHSATGSAGNILFATGGSDTLANSGYVSFTTGKVAAAAGVERFRILATGAWSVGTGGTAYGTSGQVLTSNGNAAPTWQAVSAVAPSLTVTYIGYGNGFNQLTGTNNFTWESAANTLQLGASGTGASTTLSGVVGGGTLTILGSATNSIGSAGHVKIQGGNISSGALAGGNVTIAGGTSTGTAGYIVLTTASAERFRILANGAWSVGSTGTAYGTPGQVLTSNGNAAPTWQNAGAAAGSLTGTTLASGVVNSSLTSFGSGVSGITFANNATIQTLNGTNTTFTITTSPGPLNSTTSVNLQINTADGSSNNSWQMQPGNLTIQPGSGGMTASPTAITSLLTLRGAKGSESSSSGGSNGGGAGSVIIDGGTGCLNGATGGTAGAGGNVTIRGGLGSTIRAGSGGTAGAGGYIAFSTAATTTYTERFRILNNGAWSVGSTGTAYGTSGQVLTSNGNAAPTWQTFSVTSLAGTSGTTGTAVSAVGGNSSNANGGAVTLTAGNSTGGGFLGGAVNITGGTNTSAAGAGGGPINITGGTSSISGGSNGGSVTISGGANTIDGGGGAVFINGGSLSATNTNGLGGSVSITAGNASLSGIASNGGNVNIRGGRSAAAGGYISLSTAATTTVTERVRVKENGAVRYVPMAEPASAEAGDVYYDSTSNKLRCYNGTIWNDLF